jgi:FAD/FMN-containing dehydrogenase
LAQLGWSKSFALAGVINGGTHGSNKDMGIMAAQVRQFKMVLANGTLVTASATQNTDLFYGGMVTMGTIGVMYEVSMAVVPNFKLHLTNVYSPKTSFDGNQMLPIVQTQPYVEWWWFPSSQSRFWQQILRVPVTGGFQPPAAATNSCLVLNGYNGPVEGGGCVDTSYVSLTDEEPYHYWEMESFIPWEHAGAAVNEINAWFDSLAAAFPNSLDQQRRLYNSWLGARFVKADEFWTSPAYGRNTCVISWGFYNYCLYENCTTPAPLGPDISEEFFEDWPWYEERMIGIHQILLKYGGRPHWGKLHVHNSRDIKDLYPRWNDFLQLKAQYDPNGKFTNAWSEKIFSFSGASIPVFSLCASFIVLIHFF